MIDIKEIRSKTQSLSILCVDDDENIIRELKELLKLFFKKVYTAKSGEEAFEIYAKKQKEINLVLTDINMPKMDGLRLSKKIKEIDILEYIVIVTAREDMSLYANCIDIGINDIMIKPITSDKTLKVLDKYITFLKQIEMRKLYCHKTEKRCIDAIKDQEFLIDRLTGLYGKLKLDEALLLNKEYHVVLANLDNFDRINCQYGYEIGDQVLQKVAKSFFEISKSIENCNVYRVVSDEFVFLLPNSEYKKVEKLCHKILDHLSTNKIKTQLDDIFISCTIGVSSGMGQEVLKQAHIAMKESREIGKEKYYFFTNNSQVIQKREKNLKWLNKIKDILKKDAVIPYYQPVVSNQDQSIYMYESLARILEINRIIKPYYFLESAKLFNLMPDITTLMVKKVFQFAQNHKDKFSINITKEDIEDEQFIKYILSAAKEYEIEYSRIVLEFSELITTSKNEIIFSNLKKLSDKGFKLSIDDFGANHHNIKILHALGISYVKINAILIEKLDKEKESKKIVKSIIKLAHDIGAKTIAQAVSSKKIQKEVKDLGIDFSQGYYIGKPNEVI